MPQVHTKNTVFWDVTMYSLQDPQISGN